MPDNVHNRHRDYLAHHGIKGQKWGIRRYQNPDGTLTEAGKKRYLKEFKKAEDNQLKQYRDSKNKKEAFDSLHRFVRLTKKRHWRRCSSSYR